MRDRDRFDKFTERARKVLSLAQEEAQRFQHNYIGTEHLLLGLVREGEGVAAKVLSSMGVELQRVRSAVEFIIGRGDRIVLGEIGLTPRAKKVIELAVDEARRLNHHYVGTEHLLLGLVREGEGIAAGVLESLGVRLEKVRMHTIQVLSQAGSAHAATVDDESEEAINAAQAVQDEDDRMLAPSAGEDDPFNGFSVRAMRVMDSAAAEARAFQHGYIGTEHLLLGLLREEKGVAAFALSLRNITYARVHRAIETILGFGDSPTDAEIDPVPRLKSVIALARDEAHRLNHPVIGTEHLLLGLAREGKGPAVGILETMGIDMERVRGLVMMTLTGGHLPRPGSTSDQTASSGVSDRDRFDKFTERARRVLHHAQEEAQRFQHNYIGTEHLLLGFLDEEEGVGIKVLKNLGVDLATLRSNVETIIGRGDRIVLGQIGLTPRAKKVIELAVDEASRLNHHYIGTEHLLLGLIREGDGIAAGALVNMGVTLDKAREETIKILGGDE